MGQNLKVREEPLTFRRKQKHDLSKLLAALTKEQEDMLEILVTLSKDPDKKISFQAVSKYFDVLRQVSEDINKDNITRTLLESKNPNRVGQLTTEEENNVPLVDFSTIQDVE